MRTSDTDRRVPAGAAPDKRDDTVRHPYGPRAVGALLPQITRPAFRRRAPATAQLLLDWASIVGPALAAVTLPRRLSAGTLTIACAGPVALELQHLAGEVISRINLHAGTALVTRLRFTQDAGRPHATPPTPFRRPAVAQANQAVSALPPGPLRDALAALGSLVLRSSGAPNQTAGTSADVTATGLSTARPDRR